jgi:tetratricopeptide (TPR) repeat protein
VSRSPADAAGAGERDAYRRAWAAMQKLLRQGKSYSGLERNCCFLNAGASADPSRKRFATISAAAALDFPDDARGLATCDWDHDGRVDFWITNRTAPRVRLMLNRYDSTGNHWLSLRLEGDGRTINRDAVGARVEVHLPGAPVPLLRTVTAGNGFLSQSSAWQHLGLGAAGKVDKVIVRWPGGPVETFTGVEPGGFYVLKSGAGIASRWTPPDKIKPLAATGFEKPADEESESARLVLLAPLPVPAAWLPRPPGKRGLLLNFWSSTCPVCRAELKEWGSKPNHWESCGVSLASWCVDADQTEAAKVAKAAGVSIPVLASAEGGPGSTQPELMAVFNAVQQGCFGLQKDMPVPVSFLFDADARLVAIYKGPVAATRVEADFSLFTLRDEQRRLAASPDKSGKWHDPVGGVGVRGPLAVFSESGLLKYSEPLLLAAGAWYARPLPSDATPAEIGWQRQELSRIHQSLAGWAVQRGDVKSAESHYLSSLAAVPSIVVRRDLVQFYMGRKDRRLYPAMVAQLEAIVAVDPDPGDLGKLGVLLLETGRAPDAVAPLRRSTEARADALNFFQLGQALRATSRPEEAAGAWVKALELNPKLVPALHNLAWLRATSTKEALRDGKAAVTMATLAAAGSTGPQFTFQGTLAAALAEAGRFDEAVSTVEKAAALAAAAGQQDVSAKFTRWKEQFSRRQPLREP